MCCHCTDGGDRVYVVDVHIPDNSDLSPSYSGERVVSPAGASGLQRSQTPVKPGSVGLAGDDATAVHNGRTQRRQSDLSASAFTVSTDSFLTADTI